LHLLPQHALDLIAPLWHEARALVEIAGERGDGVESPTEL
jgi:hypothetical protein